MEHKSLRTAWESLRYLPDKIQKALLSGDTDKIPEGKKFTLHSEQVCCWNF